MDKNISFTLKIWRQNGPKEKGHFDTFQMKDIPGPALYAPFPRWRCHYR